MNVQFIRQLETVKIKKAEKIDKLQRDNNFLTQKKHARLYRELCEEEMMIVIEEYDLSESINLNNLYFFLTVL